MRAGLTSLVAQLLYIDAPNLNFAQVVGDIRTAITASSTHQPILTWDCDDIALLDLTASRVVIGFSEGLPGAYFTCLTVAVGQASALVNADLTDTDHDTLHRMILDRVQDRFPCDDLQTQQIDGPLSADLIDSVIDAVFQRHTEMPATGLPAASADKLPEELLVKNDEAGPADMDRLLTRLSSELVARAPSLISRAIASATPKGLDVAIKSANAPQKSAKSGMKNSAAALKSKGGLFWSKGEKPQNIDVVAATNDASSALGRPSSNELKAVRDALYAGEKTQGAGPSSLAARARQTVQILVAVPRLLTAKRVETGKTGDPPPANRPNR